MGSKKRKPPFGKKHKLHRSQPAKKAHRGNYKRARQLTRYANYAAVAVTLWMWLKPTPYFLVMPIAFTLPVIGLILTYRFRGVIEINSEEESTKPNVLFPILLPSVGALIRLAHDYDLATHFWSWFIAGILAVIALVYAMYKIKELNFRNWMGTLTTLFVLPVFLCYFWSVLVFSNCYFDRSDPQVFPARVLSKGITEGSRSTSFYMNIDAWGPDESPEKVEIDEDFFDLVNQGDEVNVLLREGTLGFPWYYVDY